MAQEVFNIREAVQKEIESQTPKCVPISNKLALTIEEAAAYSNIGQNKINELLKQPRCPFVLYVGKKKLVKRKEFERFIAESVEL